MKKILCILSAMSVFIISGCASKPSEAPLFEKYAEDSTAFPVKLTFESSVDGKTIISHYHFASEDKIYWTYEENQQTENVLYDGGMMYYIMPEENAAFVSSPADDSSENQNIGFVPVYPEKWMLTEKGEAQYEGRTYLYEIATTDNKYFLTIYANPETMNIEYVSDSTSDNMWKLTELTHSFDLRIFEIPENFEIVNIPDMN